jgi:CheY-like chemotaxis protein
MTVSFPRVASAATPAAAPEAPRPAGPTPNTRRVLVVEDDTSVRSLVANVLLGGGYLVLVARDGEEALRVIDAQPEAIDLIVTDLVMPVVGGAALARRLRELGSGARVLFISGYADLGSSELAPLGKLLPKPFTPAQLLEAVRAALGGAD